MLCVPLRARPAAGQAVLWNERIGHKTHGKLQHWKILATAGCTSLLTIPVKRGRRGRLWSLWWRKRSAVSPSGITTFGTAEEKLNYHKQLTTHGIISTCSSDVCFRLVQETGFSPGIIQGSTVAAVKGGKSGLNNTRWLFCVILFCVNFKFLLKVSVLFRYNSNLATIYWTHMPEQASEDIYLVFLFIEIYYYSLWTCSY